MSLFNESTPSKYCIGHANALSRACRAKSRFALKTPTKRRTVLTGVGVARTICGLFLFLLIATPGLSQTFRGGINGVVTDQSGATVPGAEIRATNDATGLSYATSSSNAGEFSLQDLPLGGYTVIISSTGFQTAKIDGVRVSAGAIYTLPVKLNLAQVASTIEVSAAALSLDTTATTLTTIVSSDTVEMGGARDATIVALITCSRCRWATPGFP